MTGVLTVEVALASVVPGYAQYTKGILQTTVYGKVKGYETNQGKTLVRGFLTPKLRLAL
jgi:hypothetical protein